MTAQNCYQPKQLSNGRWVVGFGGSQSKSEVLAEIDRLNGKIEQPEDIIIKAYYQDGEYLDGYTVYGDDGELLEKIGLAKYVSGWGYLVNNKTIQDLGTEISYNAAIEYTRPAREIAEQQAARAQAARDAKFTQARETGKPVVLDSYMSDDCNDPECGYDAVTVYAMPDGSTKTSRSHTY